MQDTKRGSESRTQNRMIEVLARYGAPGFGKRFFLKRIQEELKISKQSVYRAYRGLLKAKIIKEENRTLFYPDKGGTDKDRIAYSLETRTLVEADTAGANETYRQITLRKFGDKLEKMNYPDGIKDLLMIREEIRLALEIARRLEEEKELVLSESRQVREGDLEFAEALGLQLFEMNYNFLTSVFSEWKKS